MSREWAVPGKGPPKITLGTCLCLSSSQAPQQTEHEPSKTSRQTQAGKSTANPREIKMCTSLGQVQREMGVCCSAVQTVQAELKQPGPDCPTSSPAGVWSREMRAWRVTKNTLGKHTLESDTIPALGTLAWASLCREQRYLKEAEKVKQLSYSPGSYLENSRLQHSVTNSVFHSHTSPSTQNCSKFDKYFKMRTQKGEKYIQHHNHISLLFFFSKPSLLQHQEWPGNWTQGKVEGGEFWRGLHEAQIECFRI